MGYRGTREQLEARLTGLSAELEAMHERLAEASRKVDALREVQWGWLGVQWFRFTLRRALRDVDAGGRHDRRTVHGLRRAIERHERALTQGRDVLRWLEESLAPAAEEPPTRHTVREPRPSPVGGAIRGWLAVLGSVARNVWAVMGPLLLIGGLIVAIAAAVGGDGDDFDADFDVDGGLDSGPPMAPEERHAADVGIGAAVVVLTSLLAAAGAGLWWWLR